MVDFDQNFFFYIFWLQGHSRGPRNYFFETVGSGGNKNFIVNIFERNEVRVHILRRAQKFIVFTLLSNFVAFLQHLSFNLIRWKYFCSNLVLVTILASANLRFYFSFSSKFLVKYTVCPRFTQVLLHNTSFTDFPSICSQNIQWRFCP